ncbi:MAG TPA: CAP domain-containing protein [Solirubrobacterales bacterium]|nr:CAP domain-containing protein [Solirubrobacterales bacterium]
MISVLAVALGAMVLLCAGASAHAPAYSPAELAPGEACPGQTAAGLSPAEQVTAMLCMTNYARAANGLPKLTLSRRLVRSAEHKTADILGCDEFSHEACHRPFTFWDRHFGYLKGCWKVGENIARGTGSFAGVRAIFNAWLESPEHHANILGPYRQVGIGVRVGDLEGSEGAVVWTQDFGSHRC